MKWGALLFQMAILQGLFIIPCLIAPGVMASEIRAFTLTDVESELALRYLFDEQTFYQSGVKSQQDTRPTFQEEYSVNTKSYVFHPNLLSMELGGSLLFDQSSFKTLESENSNNEQLTGLNARLDFLKQKPYPVSLYYDKQNPSVSVGLGGRFIQENVKYGVDMALMQPVSPVQVSFNAYRMTTFGEGFDQLTDDDLEHVEMRLYRPYGAGNHAQLSYQIDNRDSRSGSPNLPIQTRTTSTTSAYFDSKNILGDRNQGQLMTNLSYNTQEEFPKRKELRFNPVVNWQHSQKMLSFYRLNYNNSEEETVDITQKSFTGGFGFNDERFNASMDLQGEDNKSTSVDYKSVNLNYLLSHDRATSVGAFKFSYNGGVGYRDQASEGGDIPFEIFGEEQELIGTTPTNLNRDFIIASSIVVSNTGRTQIYVEGLDYRVLIVGSQTQIQRLSAGNIVNPQIVLVDYSYQTGGTFSLDLMSNNLQLLWGPSRFYEMYIRYRDTQQKLREGNPTIQLNSVNSMTYGVSADRPYLSGINLGGEAYFEDHEEDINSYTQLNYNVYIDMPLPQLTSLRLSARRQETDNENSVEDVDLTGYILRLRSRPWLRTRLSFESSYETDVGGTLDRTLKIQRVQLGWAHRQLSLIADAHYSTEQQGAVDRERWAIKFILRRVF